MFTNVFQDKIKFNADDIFTLSGEIFWEIFFQIFFLCSLPTLGLNVCQYCRRNFQLIIFQGDDAIKLFATVYLPKQRYISVCNILICLFNILNSTIGHWASY